MNYIITGDGYTSELFNQLSSDILVIKEDAIQNYYFTKEDFCYVASESALSKVLAVHQDEAFKTRVMMLKDKVKFRELMASFFPQFHFEKVALNALEKVQLDRSKKYIVKPVRGFFGTGVYEINAETDLAKLQQKFYDEVVEKSKYFSDTILSTEEVIIETFAEGDEYAVDMYFDDDGEPQILNIYLHPDPVKFSYFHVLYYTREAFFQTLLQPLKEFFQKMNKKFKAKRFPIHAEFKVYDGVMVPIEMNPLRYGGFGLGDLTFHAFDLNPFMAYFENQKIDWDTIWHGRKDNIYAWILAYNGDVVDTTVQKPNYEKLKEYLEGDMLHFVPMDYQENPVFAIAYMKSKQFSHFEKLLRTEFNDFF